MNLRFCVTIAAAGLILPSSSIAARLPRMKDEVTKIAVGPTPQKAKSAILPADETEESSDSTDNVDKPIVRPSVIVTDAPHAESAAEAADPSAQEATASAETIEKSEAPALPAPVTAASVLAEPKKETPIATAKHALLVEGVTAAQSQKWLENGNTRYVTKKFRADGRSEKERAKKEVKPHAIILSCSDSRVPPELIFDQGLGEITTIRVAGEVLDSSVIASIEQAILNDHPHLLVVLGHTQCESIEAVMNWKEKATEGSDALDRMVSEIKPHLKSLTPGSHSPGLQVEGALQADGVARDLADRSEIIKKAVADGQLTIKTGLYWVDTGKVKFY
jgi:carbonic anhydrase